MSERHEAALVAAALLVSFFGIMFVVMLGFVYYLVVVRQ
jgi:hypothetical protein